MDSNASRVLAGVVAEKFAERVRVPDDEQRKFLVLGYALGARPVGLAVTLALANQEAQQALGPQPEKPPAPAELKIVTPKLPDGKIGQKYHARLKATGGNPPYAWAEPGGDLPKNLVLNPVTGILSGAPTDADAGTFEITIRVTDAAGATADAGFTFDIKGGIEQ